MSNFGAKRFVPKSGNHSHFWAVLGPASIQYVQHQS